MKSAAEDQIPSPPRVGDSGAWAGAVKSIDGLRTAHGRGLLRFVGPAAPLADAPRFHSALDKLEKKRWVVYCKPPFGDRDQVFRYLGRYTHRVGLSNQRLVALHDQAVTFRTRGRQTVTLPPTEFLRRFVLHVLPRGFVKIRHHGLFAPGNVASKLAAARRLLEANSPPASAPAPPESPHAPRDFRELLLVLTGINLRRCSRCHAMAVVRLPLDLLPAQAPALGPATPPQPPDSS